MTLEVDHIRGTGAMIGRRTCGYSAPTVTPPLPPGAEAADGGILIPVK
jgi:hypothetical protein